MNKIMIHGRLVRDPEMRTGASGVEFCRFTVAVDRKLSKEKMANKNTDFFNCTAFGKTGAAINAYVTKGRDIVVEGRMESSTSEKDGQKQTFWGVVVESFDFCGSKNDAGAPAAATDPSSGMEVVDTDDEIPF